MRTLSILVCGGGGGGGGGGGAVGGRVGIIYFHCLDMFMFKFVV